MLKQKFPWMVLFLVLAVFSVGTVTSQCKSFSLSLMLASLRTANPLWMILAVLAMFGFIYFEGCAFSVLMKGLCPERKRSGALTYAAADVYFSAITPSASGGQPASAFFMMWDGIPAAQTTVMLLVNLVMYTFALLFCGVVSIVCCPDVLFVFPLFGKLLIAVGSIVLVSLSVVFLLLLRKERWVHSILSACINVGEKIHLIHHPEKMREKLEHLTAQYRACSEMVSGNVGLLVRCFLMNLLQRLSLSLITVFVYLATGGQGANSLRLWCVQIISSVGSNSVPIPGAMGAADYLLLSGLSSIADVASPANLELLCRGMAFYVCIGVSLMLLLFGYACRKYARRAI